MDGGSCLPDRGHNGLSATSVWREAYFHGTGLRSVKSFGGGIFWSLFLARTAEVPMHLGSEVDAKGKSAEECGQEAVGFVSHAARGEPEKGL
jgi:hypothetical protein